MASYDKKLHKYDKPGDGQEDVNRYAPGTLEAEDKEAFYEDYELHYRKREKEEDQKGQAGTVENDNDDLIPY